jgi:serine/threonine-protein kinase
MAPEQLRGERLDRRTDVFAMGIVLWELFGRRHLFKRDTDFLTFQAITSEPIPDICEVRPDVPPALGAAIAKALARNRDDRFPTARALGQALGEAVMPLGGPFGAAAISDEIERAFESRLRDQRKLIRTAREGGVFSLEDDLGPQVGHGTEMMTTPVKFISAGVSDAAPSSPSAPAPPVVQRPTASAVPIVTSRSRWPVIALVLILLGGGALAVMLYTSRAQPKLEEAPAPVRMATISADASEPVIAVDAAIEEVKQASPPDAGVVVRTQKPPRVKEVAPSGPPGFITIDATPVYAVIYIDGKNKGETPLVKLALSPGKHAVKAVSPSGSVKTFSIVIESGKVAQTRRIEW